MKLNLLKKEEDNKQLTQDLNAAIQKLKVS